MMPASEKSMLVAGLGASGRAACALLRERGARVTGLALPGACPSDADLGALQALGIDVRRDPGDWPRDIDCVVADPEARIPKAMLEELLARGIRLISELELGAGASLCLNITVTGTNGKSTTSGLIERILAQSHRRTRVAGDNGTPVSSVASCTRDLDFLVIEAGVPQIEGTEYFRPAVAVVMNLSPEGGERYATLAERARALGRIFRNQQVFDWAIVQSEALAQLRELEVPIPSKTITFSAANRRADLVLERGMLISRLDGWGGPLLHMEGCQLQGPHNAENLMAALAVGRVLRIPLEEMVHVVRTIPPLPHRCEVVGESCGVSFVDDSKCMNPAALEKALQSMPAQRMGEPNVWLIAGGQDRGGDFHSLGPLISQRVKGAFLLGETREKLRAAWGLFTPCAVVGSLLEAVHQSAAAAAPGDVVLLSPACSSFDMFHSYHHRGGVYQQAVREWIRMHPPRIADAPPEPATT
jgi:UDP-N-acetylmuramoylalanine--D-glutamate ligase